MQGNLWTPVGPRGKQFVFEMFLWRMKPESQPEQSGGEKNSLQNMKFLQWNVLNICYDKRVLIFLLNCLTIIFSYL